MSVYTKDGICLWAAGFFHSAALDVDSVYSVHAVWPTFCGAVVSDVAGHVDGFAVDSEVSHAAHEVSVPDREGLRQVGDAT